MGKNLIHFMFTMVWNREMLYCQRF